MRHFLREPFSSGHARIDPGDAHAVQVSCQHAPIVQGVHIVPGRKHGQAITVCSGLAHRGGKHATGPPWNAVEYLRGMPCAPDQIITAIGRRAENHIHDRRDLADTITRLQRYQEAGADVLFAPGVIAPDDLRRLVREVDRPVNVLALAIIVLSGVGAPVLGACQQS